MERLSSLYASALYDIAVRKNAVEDFLRQSILLCDVLGDQNCQRMLVHPQITSAQKQEMFKNAFADHIHNDLLGFLYLVADKNREAFLLPALTALIAMIERSMNKVTAEVLSAAPYDEKQAETLTRVLSKKLNKNVELSLNVDPSVIGGPYIYADGYYIDWTVKTRLRELTIRMKEGCSA